MQTTISSSRDSHARLNRLLRLGGLLVGGVADAGVAFDRLSEEFEPFLVLDTGRDIVFVDGPYLCADDESISAAAWVTAARRIVEVQAQAALVALPTWYHPPTPLGHTAEREEQVLISAFDFMGLGPAARICIDRSGEEPTLRNMAVVQPRDINPVFRPLMDALGEVAAGSMDSAESGNRPSEPTLSAKQLLDQTSKEIEEELAAGNLRVLDTTIVVTPWGERQFAALGTLANRVWETYIPQLARETEASAMCVIDADSVALASGRADLPLQVIAVDGRGGAVAAAGFARRVKGGRWVVSEWTDCQAPDTTATLSEELRRARLRAAEMSGVQGWLAQHPWDGHSEVPGPTGKASQAERLRPRR